LTALQKIKGGRFLPRDAMLLSCVCPSVCHTSVLYQNG